MRFRKRKGKLSPAARSSKVDGPVRENIGGFVDVSIALSRELESWTIPLQQVTPRLDVFLQREVTNGVSNVVGSALLHTRPRCFKMFRKRHWLVRSRERYLRPQMTIFASAGPRVFRLGTLLLEGDPKQFQHANFCGGA